MGVVVAETATYTGNHARLPGSGVAPGMILNITRASAEIANLEVTIGSGASPEWALPRAVSRTFSGAILVPSYEHGRWGSPARERLRATSLSPVGDSRGYETLSLSSVAGRTSGC